MEELREERHKVERLKVERLKVEQLRGGGAQGWSRRCLCASVLALMFASIHPLDGGLNSALRSARVTDGGLTEPGRRPSASPSGAAGASGRPAPDR